MGDFLRSLLCSPKEYINRKMRKAPWGVHLRSNKFNNAQIWNKTGGKICELYLKLGLLPELPSVQNLCLDAASAVAETAQVGNRRACFKVKMGRQVREKSAAPDDPR
jgi:hypothetical protein